MENHQKAIRPGGKGAPRRPAKRSVNKNDMVEKKIQNTLKACKNPVTNVDVMACMYVNDDGMIMVKDPEIKAFMGNKQTPIAFLVKGKPEFSNIKRISENETESFEKVSEEMLENATEEEKLEISKLENELKSMSDPKVYNDKPNVVEIDNEELKYSCELDPCCGKCTEISMDSNEEFDKNKKN